VLLRYSRADLFLNHQRDGKLQPEEVSGVEERLKEWSVHAGLQKQQFRVSAANEHYLIHAACHLLPVLQTLLPSPFPIKDSSLTIPSFFAPSRRAGSRRSKRALIPYPAATVRVVIESKSFALT
jgi:hypothetical protein